LQAHQAEGCEGRRTDDEDLPDLAAHIVGHLFIDITCDGINQFAIMRQALVEPGEDPVLVL